MHIVAAARLQIVYINSAVGRIVFGANRLDLGRIVCGARRPWGEMSFHGAMSVGRKVLTPAQSSTALIN